MGSARRQEDDLPARTRVGHGRDERGIRVVVEKNTEARMSDDRLVRRLRGCASRARKMFPMKAPVFNHDPRGSNRDAAERCPWYPSFSAARDAVFTGLGEASWSL